ncbi:hypothetical protein [Aquitalea magnusonii]|uniref:Uncharacterized protein n=1 Tax=Aquitalea magnusonii TaxID=332411 RepID=A0A318IRW0_9NEIS|nr:hypothetical protein [Aquitalea magnusonii]PXX38836.1 hypothetical protein DFR38_1329 [Aquitalea magnusonii]
MFLGAVGSFISTSGGALLKAGSSVVTEAASIVEAHPLLAGVALGVGIYEYATSNPSHLGNSVDTTA